MEGRGKAITFRLFLRSEREIGIMLSISNSWKFSEKFVRCVLPVCGEGRKKASSRDPSVFATIGEEMGEVAKVGRKRRESSEQIKFSFPV